MDSFDRLLSEAIDAMGESANPSLDEEREAFDAAHPETPMLTLLALPPISDRAVGLIVAFEVTSEASYEKRYRHPIWPQGQSGVTIGIGYDIGYVTVAQLERDWAPCINAAAVAALKHVCGVKGANAGQALAGVHDVDVPFSAANAVFKNTTIPRVTAQIVAALPGVETLSPDSLGALVSLVYNRGASFSLEGERYKEMRVIKADIAASKYSDIPAQLRSMKRLWQDKPNMAGLLRRRELEAIVFQDGLA
ncbi:hypothetical protein J2794_006163 [Paraburkholderia terricola]|uniref:hypothetical protein n=1 Tax=Paraburkholderia terricola TaxID=169427 RepID=UPI002865D903|nr:hypothetical protein [Paraburkholderia terricola]MDR6450023.1 hypothetical protein [Paraburkholderia terricola]